MSHLWFPLALINLAESGADPRANFVASLLLFFVVLCKVMFSIQINDITDREEDAAAGKTRWIGSLPKGIGIFLTMVLAAAGLVIVIAGNGSVKVVLAYLATVLLGLFYSLRPARFKERGIWGLLVYALAATIIYVLVPWLWFNSNLLLLALLVFTVLSDKWVQLNFHQVIDYSADAESGTQTFAVRAGLERARVILKWASRIAALSMLGILVYAAFMVIQDMLLWYVITAVSIATIAASGIYIRMQKRRSDKASDLIKELPGIYLSLTYLLFCLLPPFVYIFLALKEPWMWVIAALSTYSWIGITFHSHGYKYS
jgi:4-hydroxybenzoate polyprenyltransferase